MKKYKLEVTECPWDVEYIIGNIVQSNWGFDKKYKKRKRLFCRGLITT